MRSHAPGNESTYSPSRSSKVKAAMRNNEQALCQPSKPRNTKKGKRLRQPSPNRKKQHLQTDGVLTAPILPIKVFSEAKRK